MAIDTTSKRLTIVNDFTMIMPPPDGSVDIRDRFAALDLYSGGPITSTLILAPSQKFATQEYNLVKLTIPGTIGPSVDFFFSQKLGPPAERLAILLGIDVRPYILGEIKGRPTKIVPDRAVTERSRITINMHEDGNAPPFPSASFDVTTGGEFWRRLRAAQPDYIGSVIEVRRGDFQNGKPIPNTFAAMPFVFKGRLEAMDLQQNGSVSLVAKDSLALRDRTQPSQISDTNLVDGALIATDTTIKVDDANEITDPASLSSKDFFPVVLKLETEHVIVGGIPNATDVTVAENHLGSSEDLTDPEWVKGGLVVIDSNVAQGPWGGDGEADRVTFNGLFQAVTQTTTLVAAATHNGSVWLRNELADGVISKVRIAVFGVITGFTTIIVSITNRWKRFDVSALTTAAAGDFVGFRVQFDSTGGLLAAQSCLVAKAQVITGSSRGFYAGTGSGGGGADAGRGGFGTTAASHADNIAFTEILQYRSALDPEAGVHPVVILRDLVNRGGIAVADVDQESFDQEFFFIPSTQFKRTGTTLIVENARISVHVKDVREQALLDLWVSEDGKIKTRLSFRNVSPGESAPVFTDEESFMAGSLQVRNNQETRTTDGIVYYELKVGAAGKDPADFAKVTVFAEVGIASLSGPTVKRFFSKWIFRAGEANALVARYVNRFRRGARLARFSLDKKDEGKFDVGEPIALNSVDILRKIGSAAARFDAAYNVIQKVSKRGHVEVEALENVGFRPGFITPSPLTDGFAVDYDSATDSEREFAFIGTVPDNTVGTDKDDGYTVI